MKHISEIIVIAIILISFSSCKTESKESHPDVSQIEVDFEIIRLDEAVFQMDTNNLSYELDVLMDKYPSAATLYFGTLNPYTASRNRDTIANRLGTFLKDPFFENLQDTIGLIFGNMSDIKDEYKQAYKYFKHYFPQADIANVYTMNTGFSYQRFLFEDDDESNALGVSLDLFLGNTYPYKRIDPQNPSFSSYLTRSFDKKHLVKKTMEILVDDQLGETGGLRMLDQMIHNGKRLYILDHLLPEMHDSIIIEYTTDQMNWVKENELEMWAYFFDQELFYETNTMTLKKYLSPNPNSPGMPSEAPGRTGNYIGWQIVKKFMKRHPNTSMQELIEYDDAQKLLEASKYKPR